MRLHKSLQRAIAIMVAAAVLAQSTGCSFVPARPDERTCEREKSEVLAGAKDQAGSPQAIFFNATIDGRWSCAAAVPKDVYDIDLFAIGSDGKAKWIGSVSLSVEPGRQYSVLAYETGVGYVPATAVLFAQQPPEKQPPEDRATPRSGTLSKAERAGEEIAKGAVRVALLPVMIPVTAALAIIGLPFIVAKAINSGQAKAPKARQEKAAMDTVCCFVWIENGQTREVIVGNAPENR